MKKHLSWRQAVAGCCLGVTAALGAVAPAYAQFVDIRTKFELDGNLANNGGTDWVNLINLTNPPTGKTPGTVTNFGVTSFFRDFVPGGTADTTTFTTGSKDTLDVNPGWQCTKANNVSDKVDVLNAYATIYSDPGGDTILYFGMEVASNEGTKNVGVWFFKDPTVGCEIVTPGPKTVTFSGNHTNGDLLIVAQFTSGGRTSSVTAYTWQDGALVPTSQGVGGDCDPAKANGQNFPYLCGSTNPNALLFPAGIPWLTQTKESNPHDPAYRNSGDLDAGELFEGGINLTANDISPCFNRYLADTRSAVSTTATLFDYVAGDFSNCRLAATKTCSTASIVGGTTTIKSPFQVVIKNDGSGTVYDVKMREYLAATAGAPGIPSGESCTITRINGSTSAPGVGTELNTGDPVTVAASLAKKNTTGDTVTVDIECTGAANSFVDKINAVAGTLAGRSDVPAVDAQSQACPLTPKGALDVKKVCRGIDLVPGTGTSPLTLKVNVGVTVENVPDPVTPGDDQGITITSITDSKLPASGTGALTQVVCGTTTPVQTPDLDLAPTEKACFVGFYTPTAGDVTSPPAPTDQASFSDTVTVTGRGNIDGQTKAPPTATATCFLCDGDLDSIPDVIDCLSDRGCAAPH